ncbi:hypothetical protein D3C86_1905550 [compost metagenome]
MRVRYSWRYSVSARSCCSACVRSPCSRPSSRVALSVLSWASSASVLSGVGLAMLRPLEEIVQAGDGSFVVRALMDVLLQE